MGLGRREMSRKRKGGMGMNGKKRRKRERIGRKNQMVLFKGILLNGFIIFIFFFLSFFLSFFFF